MAVWVATTCLVPVTRHEKPTYCPCTDSGWLSPGGWGLIRRVFHLEAGSDKQLAKTTHTPCVATDQEKHRLGQCYRDSAPQNFPFGLDPGSGLYGERPGGRCRHRRHR